MEQKEPRINMDFSKYKAPMPEPVKKYYKEIEDNLSEARFQFALKCLQAVMQRKASENVLFSPYSIYEGILMHYFMIHEDTEVSVPLKRILQLPEYICQDDWIVVHRKERKKENREKSNGYYDKNSLWLRRQYSKPVRVDLNHTENYTDFNFIDIPTTLEHSVNEVLRDDMQGCIPQPVKLNIVEKDLEFILSSVLCFEGDIFLPNFLIHVPNWMDKPRTVLYPKLGMFVTELLYINKTQSLYLLFPAVRSIVTNTWEVNEHISGLVKRLTTKKGTDELRKVLDKQVSSTEKLLTESVIYPDFFEMQYELPMDQLLTYLERGSLKPDEVINLSPGIAMHRAYIKITPVNVVASAVNMFFTKDEAFFNSSEGIDNSECKNSYVWMIYDRPSRTILFIGVMNKNLQLPQVSSAEHTASSSNIVETK